MTLTALIAKRAEVGLLHYLNTALDSGLKPSEISELITHLAFYVGWPAAFCAVASAKDVFAQRGVGVEQLPAISPRLLTLSQVVPEEDFRRQFIEQNITPVSPGFSQFTNELLYHEVWLRPDLTPRDRSLVTVACLIAEGDLAFLELYLGRALGHGLTQVEVGEMLTQLAFYVGWPKLISATLAVKGILERRSAPRA